jgi:hypothetical protein
MYFVSPKASEAFLTHQTRRAEPEISWAFIPRLQPGDYPAFSRTAAIYRDRQFKRWVCAVRFDILSSSLIEVVGRLTWYLNLGSSEKPRASRRSNYWAAWIEANGGPPKRKDRLSPRVFEARHARVQVADTGKSHRKDRINPEEAYSVVRSVIRWETGGPKH